MTKSFTSSILRYTHEEFKDGIGVFFTHHLARFRSKFFKYHTVLILDARDHDWGNVAALIGEGGVRTDHLKNAEVYCSQGYGRHLRNVPGDTHLARKLNHRSRTYLFHQECGHGIHRIRQGVLQGFGSAVLVVRIGRTPIFQQSVFPFFDTNLRIRHLHTWAVVLLNDGRCVDKRLEGGPYLALTLFDVVVFKILVVVSADPCFYITCLRLHRHHSYLVQPFVVHDAVSRTHGGVDISVPTKHSHWNGRIEHLLNAVHRCPALFQAAVTLGAAHGLVHNLSDIACRILIEVEGSVLAVFLNDIEDALQVAHVLLHRFLGVALHLRIDRSINFKSTSIQVQFISCAFLVVLNPPFHVAA